MTVTVKKKGQGANATFTGGGFAGGPAAAKALGGKLAAPAAPAAPVPPRGDGLAVRLSRIAGLTKPGLLEAPFHFQVGPMDGFRRSGSAEWSDFVTLGGPASRPSQSALEEFSFRSMFIDYDPSWAAYHYGTDPDRQTSGVLPQADPVDPFAWIEVLRDIRDALTPVELLVGNPALWGAWHVKNQPVTLRTLSEDYPAGEDDVIYFDIAFTEYRQTRLSTAAMTKYPATVSVSDNGNAKWTDGDGEHSINNATLHKLSTRFYGSATKWKTITRHARNRNLSTYAPGRELDDYAKKHGTKNGTHKFVNIYIPAPA